MWPPDASSSPLDALGSRTDGPSYPTDAFLDHECRRDRRTRVFHETSGAAASHGRRACGRRSQKRTAICAQPPPFGFGPRCATTPTHASASRSPSSNASRVAALCGRRRSWFVGGVHRRPVCALVTHRAHPAAGCRTGTSNHGRADAARGDAATTPRAKRNRGGRAATTRREGTHQRGHAPHNPSTACCPSRPCHREGHDGGRPSRSHHHGLGPRRSALSAGQLRR